MKIKLLNVTWQEKHSTIWEDGASSPIGIKCRSVDLQEDEQGRSFGIIALDHPNGDLSTLVVNLENALMYSFVQFVEPE